MAGVHYRLRMPEPHTHLFEVVLTADEVQGAARVVMPSWTPGSYLMREFARNVVHFVATDGAGRELPSRKTDRNSWLVDAPADGTLRARLIVYADELTVRTSHLDATHASVQGASVFPFLAGREGEPHRVSVEAPAGWRVTTPLDPSPDEAATFVAASYDHLVDSPMEIGTHALVEWEVSGKLHRYAVWGRGNYDLQRLAADTTKIVKAEEALFGGLPYPHYTFIVHAANGAGGLEHRDSTVLLADRWSFRGPGYESFLGLVAHEFFHLWNGKRIRPAVLGPFDYTREAYTRELWVVEGITTYYTDLLLRRAGVITPQRYLDKVAEQITRYLAVPGRLIQPLEDASFDAWIKFYRPDANTPNATISYYQKGALVAMLLDLEIRRATENARSLDDVMRLLWERWGARDVGFPEGTVEAVSSEVAGRDLKPLFDRWLRGTEELDFDAYLSAAGLGLRPAEPPRHPFAPQGAPAAGPGGEAQGGPPRGEVRTGMQFKFEGGKMVVSHVLAGTAAWRAGVSAGDELVALDGLRVSAEALIPRLSERKHGERVPLTVFRRDELVTVALEVDFGPVPRVSVREREDATPEQRSLREHWLRTEPA